MSTPRVDADEIFLAARAIASPDQRLGYLDGACGTDRELRANVDALTGTTPFDGKSLLEAGFAEMMRIIREAAAGASLWRYLDTLALAQHRTGDTASAITTQRRAISLLPADHPNRSKGKKRLATFEAAMAASSQPAGASEGAP